MYTSEYLIVDTLYTRKDLQRLFDVKDAKINNGVFWPAGYDSIWLFITEEKARDRPQLHDKLEGDTLYWDGQPTGRTDHLIINHRRQSDELLVFYRLSKNEHPGAGFKYEGIFTYVSHTGSQPAHFILRQQTPSIEKIVERDIEALRIEEGKATYREGKAVTRLVNTSERNPKLRTEAIRIHGTRCQVCKFSFVEKYGLHGEGYIEVHHLKPVANYAGEVDVDPSQDMAVICANCHRMIHRNPERPLTLEELKAMLLAAQEKHNYDKP